MREQSERAVGIEGGSGGDGSNGVVTRSTPPSWMDQTPPNFHGDISTYGRTSSNIWVFKKLKHKKLLSVKLLRNTACCPFQLAVLDWLLGVIRKHGLLSSRGYCFKKLKCTSPVLANLANAALAHSPCCVGLHDL